MTPLERVLDALRAHRCNPRQNGHGWSANCPAHDDQVASLTVGEGRDGRVLVKCHAGSGCSFSQIAGALDLPEKAFFPPNTRSGSSRNNVVATYPYVDEGGNLLFEVVRFEPKDFRQRRPLGNGWEWNLHGVRRLLYRLPRVREAALVHGTVYVVEGEKDVEAAERVDPDIVATCNQMGAKKWRKAYTEMLRGVGRVVVVADRDNEGREHARQVATSVTAHIKDVTIVGPVEGKDLFDHLAAGHTIDELKLVARVAPGAGDSTASDEGAPPGADDSDNEHSDSWDRPVPLLGSDPLPKFPADALPATLTDYVTGLARATQTPLDLPGVMVLGALAAAAGGRAVVEVRPGWREPTNLFLGVAMAPGNRKSAVVQEVTYPLHDAERQAIEAARDGIREAQVHKDIAEKRASDAVRAAQSLASDANPKEKEQEAQDARAMAEAITVPSMPRLLADDATPEALAWLLADQGGRIALISAEGGPFDMMAGRYSKVPNLDVYLKGHAGDHIRVDRKGSAGFIIEHPALTLAVAFQPGILPKIAAGEGFRARGLLARFLFAVPHSFVGYRQVGAAGVDAEITEKYQALLRSMVLTLAEWTDPCILTFSPGANERLLELERALEPGLAPGADLGLLADWGSKLAGAVARIAGLLHLAGRLTTGYREAISEETLNAAARIGDYFLAHALAATGLMGADPAVEDARALLAWIQTADVVTFTRRDAHRANQSRFQKATDLDAGLDRLEDHGWIRRRPDPEPGPLGGRPPARSYDVNPNNSETENRTDRSDATDKTSPARGSEGGSVTSVSSVTTSRPINDPEDGPVPTSDSYDGELFGEGDDPDDPRRFRR